MRCDEFRCRALAAVLASSALVSLAALPNLFGRKAERPKPPGQQDVLIRYELDAMETGLPVTITQVGPNGVELRQYEPTPGRPRSSVIPGTEGAAAWHAALNYNYRARATLELAAPPGSTQAAVSLRLLIEGQSNVANPPKPPKTYAGLFAQALTHPFRRGDEPASSPVLLSDETWILSVPRIELQRAIDELGMLGFFDRKARPAGRTLLTLKIDQQTQTKVWDRVRTLDTLMERVRKQGKLTNYRGPSPEGRKIQAAMPKVEIPSPDVPVPNPGFQFSRKPKAPAAEPPKSAPGPARAPASPVPSSTQPSSAPDSTDDGPLLLAPGKK